MFTLSFTGSKVDTGDVDNASENLRLKNDFTVMDRQERAITGTRGRRTQRKGNGKNNPFSPNRIQDGRGSTCGESVTWARPLVTESVGWHLGPLCRDTAGGGLAQLGKNDGPRPLRKLPSYWAGRSPGGNERCVG